MRRPTLMRRISAHFGGMPDALCSLAQKEVTRAAEAEAAAKIKELEAELSTLSTHAALFRHFGRSRTRAVGH